MTSEGKGLSGPDGSVIIRHSSERHPYAREFQKSNSFPGKLSTCGISVFAVFEFCSSSRETPEPAGTEI